MDPQWTRRAAVAGSWYPGTAAALAREVAGYLGGVEAGPADTPRALVVPHAGLMYSGPVAACSYRLLDSQAFDVAVLIGPSHFVAFDGIAVWPRGAFDTPLGPVPVDETGAEALMRASPLVHEFAAAHIREHSLEMQLPFLRTVAPAVPIVPLVMGHQARETVDALASALARAFDGQRVLLVASTDLSHYHDARTAARLDGQVIELVRAFDPDGLMRALERMPEHACGGGPLVATMLAARALGARAARILKYADSGDVSGDKSAVVGYLAAALGDFEG